MAPSAKHPSKACSVKFESVNIDSLFPVLDAVAWLDMPNAKQITQFTGLDPRIVGKLLKNSLTIGLVQSVDGKGARRQLLLPVSDNYFCRSGGQQMSPPPT
jgi:hypothetical protein